MRHRLHERGRPIEGSFLYTVCGSFKVMEPMFCFGWPQWFLRGCRDHSCGSASFFILLESVHSVVVLLVSYRSHTE